MGVRCNKQVSMTPLEIKALWLLATEGTKHPPDELARDPDLTTAGERALDKVWREHLGMRKRPTPPKNPKRGAPITCGRGAALQTSAKL